MNDDPSPMVHLDPGAEVQSLRSLLQLSVVAMLITTTTVAIYFGWQYRQIARELNNRVTTLAEMPAAEDRLNTIAEKFRQVGRTNADFAQILKKYGINPQDSFPTNTSK